MNTLNNKIESLLEGRSLKTLAKERERLTQLYRGNDLTRNFKTLGSEDQRLAYLAARLPATYAVVSKVLRELLLRSRGEPIHSLLDVGAGPGTALLAALDASLPLNAATLVERDPGFIALGKCLLDYSDDIDVQWVCQDMTKSLSQKAADLVIASYCLNELKEKERFEVVEKLWESTNKFLVLIEPGTKIAFESLMKIRQSLLVKDAHLLAPCPHSNICPLLGKDWCHFSARIERSSLHRKAKDATLNYEDEKFSYLIFSKIKFELCHSRILRRPFKGTGYINLQLCSSNGIEIKTITKKDKNNYSRCRKIECGDVI